MIWLKISLILFGCITCLPPSWFLDWDGETPGSWGALRGWLQQFEAIRPLYDGDFFTLTPFSLSEFDWIGWQFHRDDLQRGMLQVNCGSGE